MANKIKRGERSRTSPRAGSRKGCLCDDGTYKTKCCNGTLRAQGVGKTQA